jgi:hypothetical protein
LEPARAGQSWSGPEQGQLLEEVRAGHTISELAQRHQRSEGGIRSHLKKLMGASKRPFISDAAMFEWVLSELGDADDWPTSEPAASAASDVVASARAPYRPRIKVVQRYLEVAGIRRSITGSIPGDDDDQEFLTGKAIGTLATFEDGTLRQAGTDLFQAREVLKPDEWILECDWPGLTGLHFTTDQLRNDAEQVHRVCVELIEAGLSRLRYPRHHDVLRKRLGLDGEFMTLGAIGAEYGVTRERIRQIQEKALLRLSAGAPEHGCRRSWDYVRSMLSGALSRPGEDRLSADLVLDFIELATPVAAPDVAVRTVARLSGLLKEAIEDLVGQVKDLTKARAKQLRAVLAEEKKQGRLNVRLERIVNKAWWPARIDPSPRRERLIPLRDPTEPGELGKPGTWWSDKLDRQVGYESGCERDIIQLLEACDLVDSYCEQPLAIPYRLYGRDHVYYPDLAVDLSDGRRLIVEVKGMTTAFADQRTVAKLLAARSYCHRRGWGFIGTNGRETPDDLARHPLPAGAEDIVRRYLSIKPIDWRGMKSLDESHGVREKDIAALVWRNHWYFRAWPYLVSTEPIIDEPRAVSMST